MHTLYNDQPQSIQTISLRGAIAGCVATIPMTIFMLLTQKKLPKGQRYALPPEIITREILQRAGIKQRVKKKHLLGATTLSHFGYGAFMGTIYSLINQKAQSAVLLKGSVYGLLVWVGSYLIVLPALKMSETGQREPGPRNMMMIVAHLIWGVTTGMLVKLLASHPISNKKAGKR